MANLQSDGIDIPLVPFRLEPNQSCVRVAAGLKKLIGTEGCPRYSTVRGAEASAMAALNTAIARGYICLITRCDAAVCDSKICRGCGIYFGRYQEGQFVPSPAYPFRLRISTNGRDMSIGELCPSYLQLKDDHSKMVYFAPEQRQYHYQQQQDWRVQPALRSQESWTLIEIVVMVFLLFSTIKWLFS